MRRKLIKFLINKYNLKLWLIVIVCGVLFGFFYQMMVVSDTGNRFKEFEQTVELSQKITVLSISIPIKDTYLLKLKGGLKQHNQPEKVFINNHLLKEYKSERRHVAGTRYRIIPVNLIQHRQNELKIICPREIDPPFKMVVSYRNYRKALAGGRILLLFDSSKYLPEYLKLNKIVIKMLIGVLFVGGTWILSSFGLAKILYLPKKRIYLYGLISFIPSLLILSVSYLSSIYSPYHIAFSVRYFWAFVIVLVCTSNICLILHGIWLEYKTSVHFKVPFFSQYLELNRVFKSIILNLAAIKSFVWIRKRGLSDNLILLLMFLLMVCALFLLLGLEPAAEQVANVAYFTLVIGVGIKLVKFIRGERMKDERH